jgi:hypothetical protein
MGRDKKDKDLSNFQTRLAWILDQTGANGIIVGTTCRSGAVEKSFCEMNLPFEVEEGCQVFAAMQYAMMKAMQEYAFKKALDFPKFCGKVNGLMVDLKRQDIARQREGDNQ